MFRYFKLNNIKKDKSITVETS